MHNNGYLNFIYKLSDWFVKLIYINILWILFTIFGLIIIGFFPATFAMFSVIRCLLFKKNIHIFKGFWKFYTADFVKSNVLGGMILFIFLVLYFDLVIVGSKAVGFLHFFYYPLLVISLLFFATILYIIPIYIHFNSKIFQLFKDSFIVMILNPINTLTMISSIVFIYFISAVIPTVVLLFSGSLLALFVTMAALRSFQKINYNIDDLIEK